MRDNEFDQMVKATMQNGSEEVPAGLWAAVQSQIASAAPAAAPAAKKTVVLPWIWRTGAALATAAAVTLAVVFTGREEGSDKIDIVKSEASSLADVPATENVAALSIVQNSVGMVPSSVTDAHLTCDAPVSDAEEQTSSDEIAGTPVQAEEYAEATLGETDKTTTTDPFPVRSEQDGIESVKEDDGQTWNDPFEEMERKDQASSRKNAGVSLAAFGNAASNTGRGGNGSASFMKTQASVPTATSITETGESSFMIPLSFGVGVKVGLTERLALGLGVNGSYLSRTYAGTYREVDENGVITRSDSFSDIRNQQYYIGIPVNLYVSILSNKHVDFYAYAGGSVDKCVSSSHKMVGPDSKTTSFKDELPFFSGKGFSYSAGGGIGVEFLMGEHLGLYIDPSLRYRFKGTAPTSIWTKQPLMFGFEAGLRIRL